jgi:mannose-6-phosphate isomerase-like protein (cupin superfamily)
VKSCRTASIFAFASLGIAAVVEACGEPAPARVPPLTTAEPTASIQGAAPPAEPATTASVDAAAEAAPATLSTTPAAGNAKAAFLDASVKLNPEPCSRFFVVAAKGMVAVGRDTLRAGDVVVFTLPEGPLDVKVSGLAATVTEPLDCTAARYAASKTIVRSKDAPELRWAGGGGVMKAHLDVGTKLSPELYLGRLEGTAAVAEHDHPQSVETILAIEGSGTFTVDGQEHRLGPRQIVTVPRKTKHSYRPDPGSTLVAIQLYEPPGPEQRFVALAAAEADAGKPDAAAKH